MATAVLCIHSACCLTPTTLTQLCPSTTDMLRSGHSTWSPHSPTLDTNRCSSAGQGANPMLRGPRGTLHGSENSRMQTDKIRGHPTNLPQQRIPGGPSHACKTLKLAKLWPRGALPTAGAGWWPEAPQEEANMPFLDFSARACVGLARGRSVCCVLPALFPMAVITQC